MSRWDVALVKGRGRARPTEKLRSRLARRNFDDTVDRRERKPCASGHGRAEGKSEGSRTVRRTWGSQARGKVRHFRDWTTGGGPIRASGAGRASRCRGRQEKRMEEVVVQSSEVRTPLKTR